ncbi:putative DNA helicase chromatin remodeling SNF2 family [Helianthus annuus]|nr:putative DNA helicase chromatin remodeling SNF2 family [Helianthus annuus]
MKPKKLNAHYYKKLFQICGPKVKGSNDAKDTSAEESKSCSVSRHKKRRLCSGQVFGESVQQSGTKDEIESSVYSVSTETHNHVLPYVNKLRDYRNRGQNTVFFDGQDRLAKVVSFVSSLLDDIKKPILIIASSSALSLWETEFSKWSKSVNVVTYKGTKDIQSAIKDLECQVLLSSPDDIFEDMDMFIHIKWELLVLDECQRAVFSTHFTKFQMLMADMKLLTVTGESVDTLQSYRNILSLVDCKNEKIHIDADMKTNDDINTLKEKLSPFIAFECMFSTPEFDEYWVPVHLSSTQIEQYCSILVSNSDALTSSSRKSPLHNVITQIQKCCDHPYLADPTLRNSLKNASSVDDPLAAEINISGKLQVLDKLLLEIKRCGLRTLVLFQSAINSEKISTGHFLDDLVHQRFGENSYVYISGKILSNSSPAKKKELLETFNNVDSESFICLFDYQACHSSIRLSRVDVVILFNSDPNPLNDVKALKRITIDSHRERLNVFRLYSAFTVEEKALILSKQGTTVDSYNSWSVCHQLLGWGAPYLFGKLESSTDSGTQSFINDLVHEVSSLLTNTSVETGPANRSIVSNAQMQNGGYSRSIVLFGETETRPNESCSVEFLSDNSPSDFWSDLVKQSQHRLKSPCSRLSRRVQKPTQKRLEGENQDQNDATNSSSVKSNVKSKRKALDKVGRKCARLPIPPSTSISDSVALNPTTSEAGPDDQLRPRNSSSLPLETETERIRKEREQITKSYQEKKSMLLVECEKEILEVQKKYDALINDSETCLTTEIKILDDYQKLVDANKLLAEILARNWRDKLNLKSPELNLKRAHKDTSAVNVLQIPASALVRPKDPCLTRGPTRLAGSGLRFPAPHLRSSPSMFATSIHNRPATGEPSLEPLAMPSTTQTVDEHCAV